MVFMLQFSNKILYKFVSSIQIICLAHPILLDLIIHIIFDEAYKL